MCDVEDRHRGLSPSVEHLRLSAQDIVGRRVISVRSEQAIRVVLSFRKSGRQIFLGYVNELGGRAGVPSSAQAGFRRSAAVGDGPYALATPTRRPASDTALGVVIPPVTKP